MKLFKAITSAFLMTAALAAQAANVDEIINTYHENIGGADAWRKLKGIKFTGEASQGPMKFPIEVVQQADGKQYTKVEVQGKIIMQGVFDGEALWNTNFMTMKAEKAQTEETENKKLDMNDFPDSLLDYKSKGYTAELVGTETVDGADAYKVKLVKEPVKVEGKEVPNVSYYYFDTDAMIIVMVEEEIKAGPAKGQIMQVKMSDYQEVDGLYFPFSMMQGVKGAGEAPMTIKSVELNPTVDASVFAFPTE